MNSIFPYLPLIVGSIFLAFGLNIILGYSRFKRIGRKVNGRVKAIEKYIYTENTDGHRTRSTLYRPIVEYLHNNKDRIVKGIGVSEIMYKLNQSVSVLIIESEDGKIQARVEDKTYYIIGVIFALAGAIILGVYLFAMHGSLILTIAVAPGVSGLGYLITCIARNPKYSVRSEEDNQDISEDSILIETKSDYIKEVSSHGFWGNIIAFSFMFLSFGIMYLGYDQLPAKAQTLLTTDINGFWNRLMDGSMPSSWEKALMLIGIGLFFFLASLRSIFYVRKKYGALLKM